MTSFNHKPNQRIVEVREDWTMKAPAQAVWEKICEQCSLKEWHPRVAECVPSTDEQGRIARDYTLKEVEGLPTVTMYEVELLRSDPIMTITYVVDVKNLPLSDYHAQITVTPLTETDCRVMIRSRFVRIETGVPGVDARDIVSDFYIAGLSKLAEIMRQD